MKLYTEKKQTIDIESTPFSKGGEGGVYNPQNEKLHRRKTKRCLPENEAYL